MLAREASALEQQIRELEDSQCIVMTDDEMK
jgi:hypothetical protein